MRRREILIVKLGALGDVVRTTGLLKPLRRRYAPCRISWLTARSALPLLRGLPLERKAAVSRKLPSWLGATRFDLILSMDEDRVAARSASALSGERLLGTYLEKGKVLYTPDSEAVFGLGLLADDRAKADSRKRANRLSYQRLWARVLGLKGGRSAFRPLAPGGKRRGGKSGGGNVVAVHAGSGARWPSKRLPEPVAAELLRRLTQAGFSPVLITGPGEKRRNTAILRAAKTGRLAPVMGVAALARWLAGCRAVVATDSLPMHLALAVATPCVALFGPTCPAEIETFGPAVKLTPRRSCRCFYRPVCSGSSCLGEFDAGEVVRQVRRLIGSKR
jgi:heptosyltransferase-2